MNAKLKEENKKLNKDIFQLRSQKKELISKYNVLNYEHSYLMNLLNKNKIEIPFTHRLILNHKKKKLKIYISF